jgi:hypothetical protein
LQRLTITRVLDGPRRGSSRPVLAETPAGPRLVKLRGAAQGTGPLVAEVIVAALAETLDLRVPARSLVTLLPGTPTDDRDEELGDLLRASVGLNLGFSVLPGARDLDAGELGRIDPAETAAILWLDRLTLNPDRTLANPNLLWSDGRPWLIDHGAALRFQYDWPAVTEGKPREVGATPAPHIFEAVADTGEWATWDPVFAGRMTRAVLEDVVAAVPDEFLAPMLVSPLTLTGPDADAPSADALRRRRAAYVAFLWKRLQPPRAFAGSKLPPP